VSAPVITLSDVVKRARGRVPIDGVSVAIAGGGPVALVGPGGSGKSTLLRLIAGLSRPDAGGITVLGHDAVADPAAIQTMIGYVPQLAGLHDHLRVREELGLHAVLRNLPGGAVEARTRELLDRTGLSPLAGARIASLRGQDREKLGLACALVAHPRLLLLDQPGSLLDPPARRALLALARELAPAGCTLLWSTESFADAASCPEVLLLHRGRLLAHGSPGELAGRLAGRVRAIAMRGPTRRPAAARLRALPGVLDVRIDAAGARVLTAAPLGEDGLGRLAELGTVGPATASLEDSFVLLSADERQATGALQVRPIAVDSEPAIIATGLARLPQLHPLDLSVARGEIVGLLGTRGAGKTRILRLICGLAAPTGGSVRVAGFARSARAAASRRIGYMPAAPALYGELSARQNLRVFAGACRLDGRRAAARAAALLAALGLEAEADCRAAELRPGARQLLSLACAVVHQPEILLLDEPTAGTDPITRREIWRHLEGLAMAGAAILAATPDADEAEQCDRLLVLHRGRVVASGPPADLQPIEALLAVGDGAAPAERVA
jgi:ABC-2 type transport system ATP-binding protein